MTSISKVADNSHIIAHHKAIIVGCGHSGVVNAVKLRNEGIEDFIILERADRPGGCWRDNTYPGCACDVPSVFYSYSFQRNPDWSHTFPGQEEILHYIEDTVETLGLEEKIRFNTDMIEAEWLEDERQWKVVTNRGEYRSKFVIFATGPLTQENIPDVEGIDSFKGEIFHSAKWNHDIDLTGKRVAVIGTGASAAQFIPRIQKQAKEITVFQRTAPWVLPRPFDRDVTAAEKAINRRTPLLQNLSRDSIKASLGVINYALIHPWAMKLIEPLARRVVRKEVPDRELRKKIMPNFTIGCKRIIFSNEYYQALQQDNVRVIASALESVDGNEVIARDTESVEADVIIFATGFQVTPPPVADKIRTPNGEYLSQRWQLEGPEAYLGTTVYDLPNAFIMVGPNILVYSSFIEIAEWQATYIVDAIKQVEERHLSWFRLSREASREYNRVVQDNLQGTVWNSGGCDSYYLDENGRNLASWPWTVPQLKEALQHFDLVSYRIKRAADVADRTPASRGERAGNEAFA